MAANLISDRFFFWRKKINQNFYRAALDKIEN
jgi:hypothetical protein